MSLSKDKIKCKPVFHSGIAKTSGWKSRHKSQSRGLDGDTKPAPSIQHLITTHVSKPPSPIPASVFDPTTSVCFQEGTSEIEPQDTDPEAAKLLWWEVGQTLHKRKRFRHTMLDNEGKGPAKRLVFGPLSYDPKTEITTSSKLLARAHAYDTQFQDFVLRPRGILSNETGYGQVLGQPYKYFQTSVPPGSHSAYYTSLHPTSSIWLDMTPSLASFIVDQYRISELRYETEEVFSDLAKEFLLKHDSLRTPHSAGTCRITERKVEWGPAPDNRFPLPPMLPSDKPAAIWPYEFRLNPDITYYLSLKAISHECRDEVSGITPVVSKSAVAAYFTVELKKDDLTEEKALHQVTAASAMCLHHRVILRQKGLAAEKTIPTLSHFQDLKHYALTLRAAFYTFWVAVPTMTPDGKSWRGCTLRDLCNGKLGSEEKVMRFAEWVNEIHNWGLGSWADGFLDDVKILLRKSLGA